jgi:hypothetical protein
MFAATNCQQRSTSMNDEHRIATRHRSFLQGRIYFNHRRSSVDCLIRDISDTGAKLIFSDAVTTPEFVELHIPNKQETYAAKVQWRRGDAVGVEFIRADAPSISPATQEPAPDLTARVTELEHTVAKLQRIVTDLRNEVQRTHG